MQASACLFETISFHCFKHLCCSQPQARTTVFHVKKHSPSTASAAPAAFQARESAFAVLKRCGQSAPVQAILDEQLRHQALSAADSGLTSELVYGYLRHEISLMFVIKAQLKAPDKLPPDMLCLLALALYELAFLDRIPARATVHTFVNMIASRFGSVLTKVANAVLRSLSRSCTNRASFHTFVHDLCTVKGLSELSCLAKLYSIPEWILKIWNKAYGPARTEELALAASQSPQLCVRVNPNRPDWEQWRRSLCAPATQAAANETCLEDQPLEAAPSTLAGGEAFGRFGVRFARAGFTQELRKAVKDGRASFQGAGSQLILEAMFMDSPCENLAPRSADKTENAAADGFLTVPAAHIQQADLSAGRIWDACAGRGGKTLALLEAGFPVRAASDPNASRLRGLRDDARRLGLPLPALFRASACVPPFAKSAAFSTIMLDAPCSGLGTLARHPDLRRLRKPEDFPLLVALQKEMLEAAWSLLPVGGTLVYMTCTVNPSENETQIQSFLARHDDALLLREWRSTPDHRGTDLMYGARIQKTNQRPDGSDR